jgi:hypothetical protein
MICILVFAAIGWPTDSLWEEALSRATVIDSIEWDAKAIDCLKADAKQPPYIVQRTLPDGQMCKPCQVAWKRIEAELNPIGWKTGPGGHFRQEAYSRVNDESRPVPYYQLVSGGELVKTWDHTATPVELAKALHAEQTAAKAAPAVGAVRVATAPGKVVAKSVIESLRPLIGDGGKLSFEYAKDGRPAVLRTTAGTVTIPARCTATWSMPKPNELQVKLSESIRIQPGSFPITIEVTGFAITEDKLTASIPWLPDAVIELR